MEGEDEEGFLRDEDMVGRNRGGGGGRSHKYSCGKYQFAQR